MHGLFQPAHRGQERNDHAEQRVHADGQQIVKERVDPRIRNAVIQPAVTEEDRAGHGRNEHPRNAAHSRAERELVREQARQTETGERHEIVKNKLYGMHDPSALYDLQKRIGERREESRRRAERAGVHHERQHGNERDRTAERHGEQFEIGQDKRERQHERAVDQRACAVLLGSGGLQGRSLAIAQHGDEQHNKQRCRGDEEPELQPLKRGKFLKEFELHVFSFPAAQKRPSMRRPSQKRNTQGEDRSATGRGGNIARSCRWPGIERSPAAQPRRAESARPKGRMLQRRCGRRCSEKTDTQIRPNLLASLSYDGITQQVRRLLLNPIFMECTRDTVIIA